MGPDIFAPNGAVTPPKRKRSNSTFREITHKRYLIRKEQKRFKIDFNEKLTKLSNEHRKQIEDLEAEKERKLQDIKLQEDDIDFEESLLTSTSIETSFPVQSIKVEPITISDDEEEDKVIKMEELNVDPRPSRIVCLGYRLESDRDLDDDNTNVLARIEDEGPSTAITELEKRPRSEGGNNAELEDDKYIEPGMSEDRVVSRKNKQSIKANQQSTVSSTKASTFQSSNANTTSTNTLNGIHKYFHRIHTEESEVNRAKQATTIPPIGRAQLIQTQTQVKAQQYNEPRRNPTTQSKPTPPTKAQRLELQQIFISKVKSEITTYLNTRLTPLIRNCLLSEVAYYKGSPSQFFEYFARWTQRWSESHPSCCVQEEGRLARSKRRCYMLLLGNSFKRSESEFQRFVKLYEKADYSHEEKKRCVSEWPLRGSGMWYAVIERGVL